MGWLYELHCHTAESSKCGKISGAALADFYHKCGFAGIIVSDHFLNGNTLAPRRADWETRIFSFGAGYRAAKARGDGIGMDVFYGWEFSMGGTDFLTFGLGEDFLLSYPHLEELAPKSYADVVHRAGGYLVQAHPFREASYIEMIRLMPRDCDGVEVYNACRDDLTNRLACRYAEAYGLVPFCGTDNHVGFRERIAAMELPFRAKDTGEIAEAVLRGEGTIRSFILDGTEENFTLRETDPVGQA